MDEIAYHLGRVVEEKLTDGMKRYAGIPYATQQKRFKGKVILFCIREYEI